jgi:N-acetylmuramoyl-L-alanine amidase
VLLRHLKAHGAQIFLCLCVFFGCSLPSRAADPPQSGNRPFVVVIDPGHNPQQGGALGARGIYEVRYNDALSAKLAAALQATGMHVVLTRAANEEISLGGRAELANTRQADLFLAVHHDSAQLKYLNKTEVNGATAYQTRQSIAGYSIFVSAINPKFAQSLQFAKLLGDELRALGRPPTLHHAEPIAGENRALLDADLGIYQFDELLVLRKTTVPAVLLEVGVIVDRADEAYVSDNAKQDAIVKAILAAVNAFRR